MPKRLVFTGKQQVKLETYELPAPGPQEVRVRTLYTLMSTGTENICYNRLFEPGTHWDAWVKYPFYPGYLNVGEVVQVGSEVQNWQKGDRVVSRTGHRCHYQFTDPTHEVWKLPSGIDPKQATWFGLAKITAMGARAARHTLGDSVAVVGAGPIGQMTVRWAAAAGTTSLMVIDLVEKRLEMARRGGATATIALPVNQAIEAVKAANDGQLPRIVYDTTGHPAVFAHVLALPARFGRVVLIGDTGTPSQQHLTADVVTRGLTIVGAHDGHEDAEWNSTRIFGIWSQLVLTGRFSLDGLITHTFTPEQCVEAYRTANEQRGETMGILFDWTKG